MPNWKALNIESDDESDIEIDDTKELQIEDALKLYQTALKYHAEGPASFDKAAEAYQTLFKSEIFQYPESQTELRRVEVYGSLVDDDDTIWVDSAAGILPLGGGSLENGPSTLPQILHLSHKNYAHFQLEYLTSRLNDVNVTLSHILTEASTALDHFVNALDKDDTDLDLWRRTATVGKMLNSNRIARFCLEAVLEGDDEGITGILRLPGLEESLAGEQLRELIMQLDDTISMLQGPLSAGRRRILSKMLKQRLSEYQHIVAREKLLLEEEGMPRQTAPSPQRLIIKAPSTWVELGDILLRQFNAESYGTNSIAPGTALSFDMNHTEKPRPTAAVAEEPAGVFSGQNRDSSMYLRASTLSNLSIDTQFPGLDGGKPTVQPRIAPADPEMQPLCESSTDSDKAMTDSPTMTLVSRKRSGEAAGLHQDVTEEGRTKSKRIRARDSNADTSDHRQAMIDANIRWEYEQQLNELQAADDWMFETVGNLFERIGVVGFEKAKNVRQELNSLSPNQDHEIECEDSFSNDRLRWAKMDIFAFLRSYSDQMAYHLLHNGESLDFEATEQSAGFNGSPGKTFKASDKPVMDTDGGLREFLAAINDEWMLPQEVAYMWVTQTLLQPGRLHPDGNTYTQLLWPEQLKAVVVRTIVNFDEHFFQETQKRLKHALVQGKLRESISGFDLQDLAEIIEAIFELHLDIYTLIKQPNSGVDVATITTQGDRLQRWSELAREAMHFRTQALDSRILEDPLILRFLWATTFNIVAASEVGQDHATECMKDLRDIFVSAGEPVVQLQNNAVMPELSVAAIDREISRLTTKEFFLKVTNQDVNDPAAVIESLEPLLEALDSHDLENCELNHPMDSDADQLAASSQIPPELIEFVRCSSLSVRLLLWQRLRDAYQRIKFEPMVLRTYFRMMAMIIDEVKSMSGSELSLQDRQALVLKSLRLVQELVAKIIKIIQDTENPLECIDEPALKSAVNILGEVLQLLQVFNVFGDSVKVGQAQPPVLHNGLPVASFTTTNTVIHEMQLNIWMILYALLQEAIYQNPDAYVAFVEDKFDFLRCVHRNLGLRGICGGLNRVFVLMLKDEFVHMTFVDGYESEQAQVLYDLHGLNCFLNPSYELIEHRCVPNSYLDRAVAMQAVDLLLAQATKLPIKELIKHPLKDTIDRVHGSVARKKPTEAILRNREIYRTFLRSPIYPLDLYNCLKGEGNQLPVSHVPKGDAVLASKGWYFLMGHIALTKFRSQKRTGPVPTEDVDIAIAFFMQDLEYSMENWETWFRLAQAYDTKIEESVVWSAEKLNNSMQEIVQLQRAAIHCFTMATALAYRSAELTLETEARLTELYQDFAMRLYSSSREPFDMQPFANEDQVKYLSTPTGQCTGRAFEPLGLYTTWKLAKVFFQRALVGKPENWFLHYMLGKCLWKMHTASDQVRRHAQPPLVEEVLQSFIRAIDVLADTKKDSRDKREPTLEPHYKLVSTVHKLVTRGEISLEEGCEALRHTPYARTTTLPRELGEWVPYVLTVLKNLRAADKSNWHHRMIARAAHIVYDISGSQRDAAPGIHFGPAAAKNELTQQMFTKTMVLQVWRPECERPGRHFVYTARYTRFFTRILEQLKDRQSLEALARRVRRRPHDLFEHNLIWQDICNAYLRLLRDHASMPEGLETSTFSNIAHEEFLARKEPLENWMQAQDTGTSAALDVLREVQELKKINQSLMKPGPIDDLIGDTYAYLFNTIGKQLWEDERRQKQEEACNLSPPPPVISVPRNPMMSLNHLINVDATTTSTAGSSTMVPTAAARVNPPPITPASDPPVRKKIGVGRREIRTCAEACTHKATATPAAKIAPGTRVQVVIDSSRINEGTTSVESSAPGSIHDSADESELSELEEEGDEDETKADSEIVKDEVTARPTFPGLQVENVEDSRGSFTTIKEQNKGVIHKDNEIEDVDMA